ncbi:MAG: PQQ-binding-like beta-propeller repeat protein, partial [Planctomycetota bacterium]|nr:PQQ-binding-like beta-propeller repeat protein [Planctomycetota bacterium]
MSLYDGSDVAVSFQDPGAKTLQDEISRLPFKHVEWEFKFNDVEIRRMTVAGDHLYIETNTNQLIAVDRFIGEVKWIYHVDSNRPLDFPPVVAQGVPEAIGVLEKDLLRINRAIDDTVRVKGPGEEVKNLQKERAEKREKLKVSRFGDNVYFLSQQVMYCLDRISGTLRWTRRMEFVPSAQPTATQFYVFVSA